MKKIINVLILLVVFTLLNHTVCNAKATSSKVDLLVESDPVVFVKEFDATIKIIFDNTTMYNENVFVSYHILDTNKQMIVFENERLPLVFNGKEANAKFSINLNNIPELMNERKIIVSFDIVDQQNTFWYGSNPNVNFKTGIITFETNNLKRILKKYIDVFTNQTISFALNLAFIMMTALVIVTLKRKQKGS